jgi:hypothetical protein
MKYYLDYNNGNIFKNLDETRFNVTTDFNKRTTHYLLLSDEQVAYKEAHPYASPYDIWNMTIEDEPIIEEPFVDNLQSLKENILKDIERYDKSVNVNLFYVNGEGAWFDKDTRVGLINSTLAGIRENKSTAPLWINNKCYIIKCEDIIALLDKLELYALACFNTTSQHKAFIINSESEEDIIAYNYKNGYPEKLMLTI